jgi:cytochrome c-type biogenesis protein CcmF
MIVAGQLALLTAFIAAGFAAFALLAGTACHRRGLQRAGTVSSAACLALLSAVTVILIWALLVKDFRFACVAENSDRLLPWYYSLSAFWVGQAGSLLLWSWLLSILAMVFGLWPRTGRDPLRPTALGILMAYLAFLLAVMIFGADPMQPSLETPRDGTGLSPLLQHPVMLVHPPIVFLGYAGWAIPFALAAAALVTGRLDSDWVKQAHPWSLFSWIVLGCGILLGADWAYEELGWGGYWSWDPVENGSLIPWIVGTVLIHASMAWQHRGVLKKTSLALAVATFALCNFATFLTRSGIFSSLHAFSQSPIGWMFLAWMLVLAAGGLVLLLVRRGKLRPQQPIRSFWTLESLLVLASLALLLLALVTIVGTSAIPLSKILLGRAIMVGPAFYNGVLMPVAMLLLVTISLVPLLSWGRPPAKEQKRAIGLCLVGGAVAVAAAMVGGVRHPLGLAVAAATAVTVLSLAAALVLEVRQRQPSPAWPGLLRAFGRQRRQYAGFVIHLAFLCLAIGVTGSSLGTQRREALLAEGETIQWAGRQVRFVQWIERKLPDQVVVEAELEIGGQQTEPFRLLPARHFYPLQRTWTTQVAIHADWAGDFYTILHDSNGQGRASLTLLVNPLMRWMWLSGGVALLGTLVTLWPARKSARKNSYASDHGRIPSPELCRQRALSRSAGTGTPQRAFPTAP